MSNPLLPELERELHGAAQRLDASGCPRRAVVRAGCTAGALFGVILATTGVGAAAARVAHLGPFEYLDGLGRQNPKLAAASTITVDPGGETPAWKAIAYLNRINQLCITGGARDPRTNPNMRPTEQNLNNPPISGTTCADSDEIAQSLVDPNRPGATFAANSPLDGSPEINMCKDDGHGKCIPYSTDYPTRMLVYAAAPAGLTPSCAGARRATRPR